MWRLWQWRIISHRTRAFPGEELRLYTHVAMQVEMIARATSKLWEYAVGNNKNANQKRPSEKRSGTFHYNPGNMSGKTAGVDKKDAEAHSNSDKDRKGADARVKR
jgi:hypothetical protein